MPNYEKSYWKAVELKEKIEMGTIRLHKRDAPIVCALLREGKP